MKIYKRIVVDVVAWLIAYLLLFALSSGTFRERMLGGLSIIGVCILLFYTHRYLEKKFLLQKKYFVYGVFIIIVLFACNFLLMYLFNSISPKDDTRYFQNLQNTILVFLITLAVNYGYRGIWLVIQIEKMKVEQLEAELKLLQSQVNPHFLFNTLNNLYALNQMNPAQGSDMLLTLADLMRYQTEASKKKQVKLSEEMEFIKNFIALEKIRLGNHMNVVFKNHIDPNGNEKSIAPFLLIPFVENAFKHSLPGLKGEKGFIEINISYDERELKFYAANSIPQHKSNLASTKTGIENVQKRLNLIYAQRHQLSIEKKKDIYTVNLSIQL